MKSTLNFHLRRWHMGSILDWSCITVQLSLNTDLEQVIAITYLYFVVSMTVALALAMQWARSLAEMTFSISFRFPHHKDDFITSLYSSENSWKSCIHDLTDMAFHDTILMVTVLTMAMGMNIRKIVEKPMLTNSMKVTKMKTIMTMIFYYMGFCWIKANRFAHAILSSRYRTSAGECLLRLRNKGELKCHD